MDDPLLEATLELAHELYVLTSDLNSKAPVSDYEGAAYQVIYQSLLAIRQATAERCRQICMMCGSTFPAEIIGREFLNGD